MCARSGTAGAVVVLFHVLLLTFVNKSAYLRNGFGAVPLGRACEAPPLAPNAVDQNRCRQTHHGQGQHRARILRDIEMAVANAGLSVEAAHRFETGPIDLQRQNMKIRSAEARLQRVERRHLLATRLAPSRPNVQKHDTSLEVRQRQIPSISIHERRRQEITRSPVIRDRWSGGGRACRKRQDSGKDVTSPHGSLSACNRRTTGRMSSSSEA